MTSDELLALLKVIAGLEMAIQSYAAENAELKRANLAAKNTIDELNAKVAELETPLPAGVTSTRKRAPKKAAK